VITARAVSALVLLAACGVRTRPLPPELVQPQPPTQLVATSVPEGIRLAWRRPSSYSGGQHMRDLGRFDVERAPGTDGGTFAPVAVVEVTDQFRFRQEKTFDWTDTDTEVGATYRYRVIAVTLDDYRSAPGGPVTVERRAIAPKPGAEGSPR
jgi:hypothetical protein